MSRERVAFGAPDEENGRFAQDRDATRASTADVDETSARRLLSARLVDDVVVPVPDHRLLVHDPSGEAFDSIRHLPSRLDGRLRRR